MDVFCIMIGEREGQSFGGAQAAYTTVRSIADLPLDRGAGLLCVSECGCVRVWTPGAF